MYIYHQRHRQRFVRKSYFRVESRSHNRLHTHPPRRVVPDIRNLEIVNINE